jgi:hypothetical protein
MVRSRTWFVWRAVAAVVLVALLVAGGFAVHRLGWSQGYAAAELAGQGEEASRLFLPPQGWHPVGFVRGGLFISLLLGLLFFALIGKLLRIILWGAMAGPAMCRAAVGGSWRHPRHGMHGPVPPWYGPCHEQPDERSQESGDKAGEEA